MWTRIVGGLVVLIVLSFAVQWVLPQNMRTRKGPARQYLKWDIAPLLGFFGLLLLGLSLVEAFRSDTVIAWGSGDVLGLIAGIVLWTALLYAWRQPMPPIRKRESSLRLAWRIVRTYGIVFLFALLALNIAIRMIGSMVEVFVAGAAGVFIMAIAVVIFTRSTVTSQE